MMTIFEKLHALYKDEQGATMVEYALMAALIAAACVGAVGAVGRATNNLYVGCETKMR